MLSRISVRINSAIDFILHPIVWLVNRYDPSSAQRDIESQIQEPEQLALFIEENFPKMALLSSQIIIGLGRDFPWGTYTSVNIDLLNGKAGRFVGTTFSQVILSLLPTAAAAKFTLTLGMNLQKYKLNFNRSKWIKTQLTFMCSSLTSIPFWNGAQVIGVWCGKKLGLDLIAAGYFSGIFTGVIETIWQQAIVIPRVLHQPVDFFEVTFNTLGGAVWQWVLQANNPPNMEANIYPNITAALTLNDISTGIQIAAALATITFTSTLVAWECKRGCRTSSSPVALSTDNSTDSPLAFSEESFSEEENKIIILFSDEEEISTDESEKIEKYKALSLNFFLPKPEPKSVWELQKLSL